MIHRTLKPGWDNERGDCGQPTLWGAVPAGFVGLEVAEHAPWGDDDFQAEVSSCALAAVDGALVALEEAGEGFWADDHAAA